MAAWLPWAVFVILGGAGYQVSAKLAAGKLPLFAYSAIIGATVLVLSFVAMMLQGNPVTTLGSVSRKAVIMPLIVGLFAFCIEIGFFLLYRNHAPISIGRMITTAGTGLVLLAVGVAFFHEHINQNQMAGVVLILVGLCLMAWK